MQKVRTALLALAVLALMLPMTSAMAIYVSQCPQQCTPSCPCSLPCDGPFGPTTCGAAGEACTNYRSDNIDLFSFLEPEHNMTPMQAIEAAAAFLPSDDTAETVEPLGAVPATH